jgi:carbonic anhydrase/acetyltransferase-like protein (isoleucine patch superfamily)
MSLWPDPDVSAAAYISEASTIMGCVVLASGVSVWPGAVIRGDIEAIYIGAHSNIQDGAVIHCDPGVPTVLEEYVTVGHRAVIHSAHLERGVLVGIGAIVLNGVRVGAGSILAAGTVVTKDVPPRSLIVGVPGQLKKTLSPAEVEDLILHARKYETLALAHAGKGSDLGFVDRPPQLRKIL